MTVGLSDVEKQRILDKMEWEGGLDLYIDYGVSGKLYNIFKNEFDKIFEYKNYLEQFEKKLYNYLKTRKEVKEYTDEELNEVNYILEVD